MSLINTTLVVQLDENVAMPSGGGVPALATALGASAAEAKQDGALCILIDGAFNDISEVPVLAGVDESIKMCTFHAGDKGATVFSASSEFKRGDIVSATFSAPTATVDGTDLDFNSFAYEESETKNSSTLDKSTRLGVGTLKAVRKNEKLHAISSGAYNQYEDIVNPGTNANPGEDFYLYTIEVRKKVGGRTTTEIIRVYINDDAGHTATSIETILGIGTLADVTGPVGSTTSALFDAATYAIDADITINILSAETGGSYTGTITTDDVPAYVYSFSGSLSGSGAADHVISDFDYDETVAGAALALSVEVSDPTGNPTTEIHTAAIAS
jgi:hypothetical protein